MKGLRAIPCARLRVTQWLEGKTKAPHLQRLGDNSSLAYFSWLIVPFTFAATDMGSGA
jgi:hypothetical protein